MMLKGNFTALILASTTVLLMLASFFSIWDGRNDELDYEDLIFTSDAQQQDLKIAVENIKRRRRVEKICRAALDRQDSNLYEGQWERRMLLHPEKLEKQIPRWLSMHPWLPGLIRINDKFKFTFCHPPKAASRTILRYIVRLSDPQLTDADVDDLQVHTNYSHMKHINLMARYEDKEKAMQSLLTYKKFVWVRNPLDRLVSAWRDKLYHANLIFSPMFGTKIIEKYRKNATQAEINKGFPVTLTEFFLYLLDDDLTPTNMNPHWMPLHMVCSMCAFQYDFIGKVEILKPELYFAMKGLTGLASVPPLFVPVEEEAAIYDKLKLLRQVPREITQRVLEKYRLDYDMFGYDMAADLEKVYNN